MSVAPPSVEPGPSAPEVHLTAFELAVGRIRQRLARSLGEQARGLVHVERDPGDELGEAAVQAVPGRARSQQPGCAQQQLLGHGHLGKRTGAPGPAGGEEGARRG